MPVQFDGCGKAVLEMDRWQLWNQRLAATEVFLLAVCPYAIVWACSLYWVLPMIIASYQNLEQIKQDTWEETAELNSRSKQWIRQQKQSISHWVNRHSAVKLTSPCLSEQHANVSEFKLHSLWEPMTVLALPGYPQTHGSSLKRQIENCHINSFYLQECFKM